MVNEKIRTEIFKNGLKHYQVAERLGVHESTFSRWLHTELPMEKQSEILKVIHDSKLVK
jgi:transposase